MALPHLSGFSSARARNIFETTIVSRRNKENDFREVWNQRSDYFSRNNTAANKIASWESQKSFQSSMDAYKAVQDKETKQEVLKARRQRLSNLFTEENKQFQLELKELSVTSSDLLTDRRERYISLRSAREEKRKQTAEEKLLEHWRINSPDIRKLESNRQTKFVVDSWSSQIKEQREQEERDRLERIALEQELEEQRREAEEEVLRQEYRKKEEATRMKQILEDQMAELREKEGEAKRLKEQEDLLMKAKWELGDIEEERRRQQKERAKMEFRQVLLHQHAAALRRRSQQIQRELEADRQLLIRLADQEDEDRYIQSARREKARADASWMKKVVEDQIRTEKTREAELNMLYQDEAAKIWQQRESEWERERLARQRLMEEVVRTREEQIQGKIETTRRQQQESLERREELLQELEMVNQLTRREARDNEAKKMLRKQELDNMVTARKGLRANEDMQLRLELEEDKMAEEDYETMLQREAQQLTVRDFQPKSYPRKQAWM